ncbi:MAG: LacI family DNA-binding transcriptional regulator [Terriglobia bacterium]
MVAKMKDVAARAGVSLTTVSHVINRTHIRSISSGTRQRVLEAAKKLNYQPNVHARRLALRRSNTVGLIISEISNPFFADVIQSFEKAASERGLDLLLFNTEYEPARIEAAVRRMVMEKVRGVAVMTSMFDEAHAHELTRNRMNVVLLNRGPVQPRIRRIQLNFSSGVAQAVDHLLELGHRSFGIITGPLRSNSAVRIRDVFVQALAQKGVRCFQPVESHYKVDAGASAVRSILAHPPLPTAILCANDLIALGAVSALQEAGIQVPEDVSVVGSDDVIFARLARPPLTTVAVPRESLGKIAFEVLDNMQRGVRRTPDSLTIETHLVIRKSTAPPPKRAS